MPAATARRAPRIDFAAIALNVLPAGESGSLAFPPTATDQAKNANPNGSAYAAGWYGYVDKDLRALVGRAVKSPYSMRYCGAGDLAACRKSISDALDGAYDARAAAQGADPSRWRADATRERITFGLLPLTMRWTNRPTFQQVITFAAHRPRR